MLLPTLRQWPPTMLTGRLFGVMGLLMAGSLLFPGLPSAWSQLVPAAANRLPGQPPPLAARRLSEQPLAPAVESMAGTTSDRSRPLIAYHRDPQELGVQPLDAKQLATASRQRGFETTRPQQAPMTNHRIEPTAALASADKVSADFPQSARPAVAGATGELVGRNQSDIGHSRRLLSASGNSLSLTAGTRRSQHSAPNNRREPGLANSFPSMDVLRTAGTGLGITLGLLLLCTWLFRRNTPSPTTPLPKEVVSVLGRAQLATRQFVQLLRVGNKLVLVSVTPEGTEPITEVTDPVEVDRLLSLCMRNQTKSTTAEFQQVLNQLSREGAKGFLGK